MCVVSFYILKLLKLALEFVILTKKVKIIKADGLPAMDIGGTSDPFVKVFCAFMKRLVN